MGFLLYIINMGRFGFSIYVINVVFGLDVMNYWFLYLSHWLFPLYYFIGWFESSLSIFLIAIYIICLICFIIFNVIFFLFYYELSIFIIIASLLLKSYSGYRIKSSFLLFIYSAMSSVLISVVILLAISFLLLGTILYLGFLFLLSLAIKVPMFPFHYWLTIVHSEASTGLSLILAALILKLGIYAILRYIIALYYLSIGHYLSAIIITSVIGIVIPYLDLFIRLDYKILIALSSITHMNMTSVGIFSLNFGGFGAGIVISISHGLNSISLFLFAGLIINKSLSHYLDSLWYLSMSYRWILYVIILSNLSMPLSLTYIGEIVALYSILGLSFLISFLLFLSSNILSSLLTFLFFNRAILYLSFLFNISVIELSLLFFFGIHNYCFGSLFLLYISASWLLDIDDHHSSTFYSPRYSPSLLSSFTDCIYYIQWESYCREIICFPHF